MQTLAFLGLAALNLFNPVDSSPQKIRVLLEDASRLEISFDKPYKPIDTKFLPQNKWNLAINASKISLDNTSTGLTEMRFTAESFTFNNVSYRGSAKIVARDGTLWLVNELDIEDYLKGVVPSEMPGLWHQEALKSQAVIARTYALNHLKPDSFYDLCATSTCQVYKGMQGEFPAANEAIESTRGLVVSWENKPALTLFHADSGGYIEANKNVFSKDLPYLTSQPDPSSKSPYSEWKMDIKTETVQSQVNRFAGSIGSYKSLRIANASSSGRATGLELQGDKGKVLLDANSTASFLRSLGAKSTLIKVLSTSPLVLQGKGFGHGVGLSQYGARGMAESGSNFAEILKFYYPGTSLESYTDLIQ